MGNSVCVDGELRENHRQKLWLVCKMRGDVHKANSQPQNKVNK